jgi:hypothetical protein
VLCLLLCGVCVEKEEVAAEAFSFVRDNKLVVLGVSVG